MHYDKFLKDKIKTTYKKASTHTTNIIDWSANSIAQELNINSRTERIAKQQAFITLLNTLQRRRAGTSEKIMRSTIITD